MNRRRFVPFAFALPALLLLACEDGTTGGQCRENRECELPLSCIEGVCQHAGCESDVECRARLFGEDPVDDGVIDVVCRDRGEAGP